MVYPSRWPRVLAVMSLVLLSMCAVSQAQTQGPTFTAPINISNTQGTTKDNSFTAQVAVDASGNIFVVWEDDAADFSHNSILCSRSTDGGKSFSTPVNVSKSANFPFNARMAVDSQGAINVVWIESGAKDNIYFSRSTDGGTTFSQPMNLANTVADSANPQIAVDANNNIHVLWANRDVTFGIFYTRSTNGGASFSQPVDIDAHTTESFAPQFAIDASGNVYVVWDTFVGSQLDVFFSVSKDNGQTFSTEQNLSNNAGNSSTPQLALDSSGNINIVWDDNTPGNEDIFFTRSTDQGTTFSPIKNVSSDPGASTNPLVGVDAKGNIFVVWQDTLSATSTTHDVWFASSSNGGTIFSTAQNLSKGTGDSVNPALLVDHSGNINVAWEDSITSNSQIFFARSTDSGATFTTSQNLTNDNGFAETVQMSADAKGNLNVVWDDGGSGPNQIFFTRLGNPNQPPVANAGSDQNLPATSPNGAGVTLDGSASTDPDGDSLTFVWTEGSTVVGNSATVQLTASIGTHTYTLTVTDTAGLSSTATTHVIVTNAPPVANAGSDQTLPATGPTTPVTLNGSLSSDPDGDALTFVWTEGSAVVGNSAIVRLNATMGVHTYTLTVTDTAGLSASNNTHVTINNQPPVANAGADQTLTATGVTTSVTLTGSASDPDGDALTFVWTQGSTVVGNSAVVPLSLKIGTYAFTLTVTDAGGLSSTAVTHVTINNATPVANAGADQTLPATGPTTSVTLNGSASTDPDGEALTFVWTQGSTVVGNAAIAPLSLKVGAYTFTLTVTDAGGLSSSAVTHVTINNQPPVANAGADQNLPATGSTTPVTLNGSASTDPDGDALTFVWTENGSVVGNSAIVQLTATMGVHTYTLTVTDAGGLSSSAVTHVTVNNQPPVANAGADQTVQSAGPNGTTVTLNGSASADPDGDALTFSWTQNGTVVGNTAMVPLSLKVGTYTFTLTVTDAGGLSSSAVTHVTITAKAPVANAGVDQTLPATGLTTPVTLNGSASTDPNGFTLTYAWTLGGTAVGSTATVPLNLKIGTYTYTLTVTDTAGLSSSAVTHVTITNQAPVANAGADQTLQSAGPNGTPVTLNGSLSSDPDGDALSFVWTQNGTVVGRSAIVPLTLNVGTYAFTLTVADAGGLSSSAVTHVTIGARPPVATVNPDPMFQCTSPAGAMVTLDGSGSTDPNGYTLTYVWTEGSTIVGRTAKVQLMVSLGTHLYTLTVSDPGGSSSASTTVVVRDTVAPTLGVSLSTGARRLRPNELVAVHAAVNVSDVCDANPKVKLVSITSNDPADRGRNLVSDVQAVGGGPVAFGTDVRSFVLRAERPENRRPLVYTVTYAATDASGNTKTTTTQLGLSAR